MTEAFSILAHVTRLPTDKQISALPLGRSRSFVTVTNYASYSDRRALACERNAQPKVVGVLLKGVKMK